jgi:autotransporter-associated beta strand protein
VDQLSISGGGTLRNGAPASTSTLTTISGYTAILSGTNCQFDVKAADGILNFKGALAGAGSLVKIGLGVLNLESNSIYTGNTVINGGTLALLGASSISNTAAIYLANTNTALDLSQSAYVNANGNPVLTVQSGQTLSGFGTATGLVQTASGATISPGSPSTVGVLSVVGFADTNTLNGTTLMKLDKGGQTNDQLSVSGSLVYGGTLALTNLSGSLAAGDSFTPFSAAGGYAGTFAGISPSRPGYPGFGLAWNTNNLAVNGTLSIVTAPVPPSPRITGIGLSGTTVTIQGTNGVANEPFVVLESTNVAAPLTNWVAVSTNAFDGTGNFNVPVGATTNAPQQFFRLWEQ